MVLHTHEIYLQKLIKILNTQKLKSVSTLVWFSGYTVFQNQHQMYAYVIKCFRDLMYVARTYIHLDVILEKEIVKMSKYLEKKSPKCLLIAVKAHLHRVYWT